METYLTLTLTRTRSRVGMADKKVGPWSQTKKDAFGFAVQRAYPNSSIKDVLRDRYRYDKIKACWDSRTEFPDRKAVQAYLQRLSASEGTDEEKAVQFGKPSNPACKCYLELVC